MTRLTSLALGLAALLALSTTGGPVYAHATDGADRGGHGNHDKKSAERHGERHGGGKSAGAEFAGKRTKGAGCKMHGMRGGMKGRHFRPDPNRMARELSVMETAIGIRGDQLDTWREFTDALQAMLPRAPRPDDAPARLTDREPFWMAEQFADRTLERNEAAKRLKQAVAELRETLTPEQLERVQTYEDSIHAGIRAHGWGDRGSHGDMKQRDMKWKHHDRRGETEMDAPGGDAEADAPDADADENADEDADEDAGGDADVDGAPAIRDEL